MDFNLDIFFKQHPECLSNEFDIMESLRMVRKYMPKSRITDFLFKRVHKPRENLKKCITYADLPMMSYFSRKPNLLKKVETYLIDTFKGERKRWKEYCLPPIRVYFSDYLLIKRKIFSILRDAYEKKESQNSPLVSIYLSGMRMGHYVPLRLLRPLREIFTLDNLIELSSYVNPYELIRQQIIGIVEFYSITTFFPYWFFLDELVRYGIEPNPGPCERCSFPIRGIHNCSEQVYTVHRMSRKDIHRFQFENSWERLSNVCYLYDPLHSTNSFVLGTEGGAFLYRHHIYEYLEWEMEEESLYISSRRAVVTVTETRRYVPKKVPYLYIEGGSGLVDGNIGIASQIISSDYKLYLCCDNDYSHLSMRGGQVIQTGQVMGVFPGAFLDFFGSCEYVQIIATFELKVYYRNPCSPVFDREFKMSLENN